VVLLFVMVAERVAFAQLDDASFRMLLKEKDTRLLPPL
jgi:hypothetical protein